MPPIALRIAGSKFVGSLAYACNSSDLNHWENETFKAIERDKKIGFDTVSFFTGPDGAVNEIMLWDQKGFFRK